MYYLACRILVGRMCQLGQPREKLGLRAGTSSPKPVGSRSAPTTLPGFQLFVWSDVKQFHTRLCCRAFFVYLWFGLLMLVEMSLAQSPVFLWSNFSHHSIGQWTLSCSNIPTLFKLQSLVVLKPSDSKLWDHPDGIWESFDAALFLVFWKILIPSEWNLHVMLGAVHIFWRPMQFQMTFGN